MFTHRPQPYSRNRRYPYSTSLAMEKLERRDLLASVNGTGGDDFIYFDVEWQDDSGTEHLIAVIQDTAPGGSLDKIDLGDIVSIASVTVRAGAGHDIVLGAPIPTILYGGSGDDKLIAIAADTTIYGGPDGDQLLGSQFSDRLYGQDGNDVLVGNAGNDLLSDGSGDDRIYAGSGNNQVIPGSGNDDFDVSDNAAGITIDAGDGDDKVAGTRFDDTIWGGAGDDIISGFEGFDLIWGDEGNDQLSGGFGEDGIWGGDGHDVIRGGWAKDTLFGNEGSDILIGGMHNDVLTGGEGDDTLDGGEDDDELKGGDGDDIYVLGTTRGGGEDTAAELPNEGADLLLFYDDLGKLGDLEIDISDRAVLSLGGLIVSESQGAHTVAAKTGERHFEWIITGDGEDDVVGNDLDNFIYTAGGKDKIGGLKGHDILVGGDGDDRVSADDDYNVLIGDVLTVTDADSLYPEQQFAILAPILAGLQNGVLQAPLTQGLMSFGSGEDTLTTSGSHAFIVGGLAKDTIEAAPPGASGPPGSDIIIFGDAFSVDAGTTIDFYSLFDPSMEPITLYDNWEELTMSLLTLEGDGNDEITGGANNTLVFTGEGENIFTGKTADDGVSLVFGGPDDDILNGGDGRDVFVAGAGDDTLKTGDGDDVLMDWEGENKLHGGEHNDLYFFHEDAKDKAWIFEPHDTDEDNIDTIDLRLLQKDVTLDLLSTNEQEVTNALTFELSGENGLENVYGSETNANTIRGNERNNELLGGTKDDLLDGYSGTDTINGDDGGDIILGDGFDLSDAKFKTFSEAVKEFVSSRVLDFKVGLIPVAGARDILNGGEGDDLIIGGHGGDEIDAGPGSALIFGGTFEASANVQINVSNIFSGYSGFTEFMKIMPKIKLVGDGATNEITGGSEINIVVGDEGKDIIYGGDGPFDVLYGNDGQDDIEGGGGADLIIGGDDSDVLRGGPGNNILFGDGFKMDVAFELDVDALLKLDAFSIARVSVGDFELTGSGGDIICGGSDFDFIVGGRGGDTIRGGDGTNIAFCDDFSDNFGPLGKAFSFIADIVTPLASINPANQVEAAWKAKGVYEDICEFFKGTDGDATDQRDGYTGGTNTDIVLGGGGDDFINAGAGEDYVVGGFGNDTIIWEPNEPVDYEGDDFLEVMLMDNLGVGGLGDDVFYGSGGDDLLFSTDGKDEFYGRDGNDIILGGGDDDSLYGEAGDDFLYGEGGDDLLDGGSGNDELVGGSGNDELVGGLGDDQLLGGPDDDTIWTGLGTDLVDGGAGINTILSELLFVEAVSVNAGGAQRSNVESIGIQFNQAPNLAALIADGRITDAVQVGGVVLGEARYQYDPSSYVLTIDLTVDGFGGSRTTMLTDGRYEVQLDTSLIQLEALGDRYLADDDGTADGIRRIGVHRLEGDFDGDGIVGAGDRAAFFAHYGSLDGQARYDFAFDLNDDGVINIVDYFALIALWGHQL